MPETDFDFSAGLIKSVRSARRVVALTGAGISAESGVPTFRDAQTGLWRSSNQRNWPHRRRFGGIRAASGNRTTKPFTYPRSGCALIVELARVVMIQP